MKAILLTFLFLVGCTHPKQEQKIVQEKVVENKKIEIPNWDDPLFKNWCPENHDNCKKHQE